MSRRPTGRHGGGDEFVPIIPGSVDELGAEHDLSWAARSMLLWLAITANRKTGSLSSVTVSAITEATRCSWRSVRRTLDELEAAGAIEAELTRGHDGWITVLWHDQIVWRRTSRSRGSAGAKGGRSRASADRSRGSTDRSRGSAIGSRGSAIGSEPSAGANSQNGSREREEQRDSSNLSLVDTSVPADSVDFEAGRERWAELRQTLTGGRAT